MMREIGHNTTLPTLSHLTQRCHPSVSYETRNANPDDDDPAPIDEGMDARQRQGAVSYNM